MVSVSVSVLGMNNSKVLGLDLILHGVVFDK